MSAAPDSPDSVAALAAVDTLLASVGLEHGRRTTRTGAWRGGERVRRRASLESPAATSGAAESHSQEIPGLETVPGWERFNWLRAGFSTRLGGRSRPYATDPSSGDQNLGMTAEDDPATVFEARNRFVERASGGESFDLVTTRQFHSGLISTIMAGHGPLRVDERRSALRGDGLITAVPGLLLGVLTADCVPVLVADTRTHAVAAFHAGWRGTLARIVERGIGTMGLCFGSRPEDLVAAIGPAIGACCFAVGEDLRFDFESQFAYAPGLFSEVYDSDPIRDKYPLLFMTARAPGHSNLGPQTHVDLHEANRRQLLDAGLSPQRIQVLAECTACTRLPGSRRKYFSHRGEHGFTGRMMSVIGAVKQ